MVSNYNPDVLSCLANLSNDEVFTPPDLANKILDMLPAELWSDKSVKFLDPVSKSGVFLREIAKRLIAGLEKEFPDKQERINHIYKNQLFGIAITELTSLLSRRSVYCSKNANGKYSVCDLFEKEDGNIIYTKSDHLWVNGRCTFCGASEAVYSRGDELETYAYQFIHTENPENIFNMKFDVIIGNPPYQLSDGGFGRSAGPIYHKFVQQAKKLNPRFLTMIIPSRWFAGGKGLDDFREEMLNDNRMKQLVDFPDASECFPGVDIAGGVCFFVWEREYSGVCKVTNHLRGKEYTHERDLSKFDTFIRYGESIQIINKIKHLNETAMNKVVSSRKPFGLATNERPMRSGDIVLVWNGGQGPYKREKISVGSELIDKWNVITSKVSYDHGGMPDKDGKRRVFSKIDILPPGTICTETYLVVGSFDDEFNAINVVGYLKTRFVRFLISQLTFSQDITKEKFSFVPIQDFSEPWTDEKLYNKYGLTQEEIDFIESMIRPMELGDEK